MNKNSTTLAINGLGGAILYSEYTGRIESPKQRKLLLIEATPEEKDKFQAVWELDVLREEDQ